jgi:aspartyl-tRNA(Asn)/glutamyl-tRNA(Gln) amidotransferase subunit B
LAPLDLSPAWRASVAASLPELPDAKRQRLVAQYGVTEYDAQVLSSSRELAGYFERAAEGGANPKAVANWVMGDLMASLKMSGGELSQSKVRPEHIRELVALIDEGAISGKMAKDVFTAMAAQGQPPRQLVADLGMRQISDPSALEALIDQVIAANPRQTEQYRQGKTALLAFFVGQVMKVSRGQAQPALVNELLQKKLQ